MSRLTLTWIVSY